MELTLVGPRPRTVRCAIGVAAGLVAAALVACNGTDRAATPDSAQSPANWRSSPRLDTAVTDYTSEEFQTVVSGLYFGGSQVDSVSAADTSVVDTSVAGPERHDAVLIIEAMSAANNVSLADPGPHGTIIARLRNLRGNDNKFGTMPGAAFEYYVIMKRNGVVQIAELTRAKNPTGHPEEVSEGTIRKCEENEDPPPYSSARFGECPPHADTAGARQTSFLGVKTLWAQPTGLGSAWVSCREGCCELTVRPM